MNPFKFARMEKGITQLELSCILNVSRTYIAMIETNKTIPNGKLLLHMMYILDIKAKDLLVYYNINK